MDLLRVRARVRVRVRVRVEGGVHPADARDDGEVDEYGRREHPLLMERAW